MADGVIHGNQDAVLLDCKTQKQCVSHLLMTE